MTRKQLILLGIGLMGTAMLPLAFEPRKNGAPPPPPAEEPEYEGREVRWSRAFGTDPVVLQEAPTEAGRLGFAETNFLTGSRDFEPARTKETPDAIGFYDERLLEIFKSGARSRIGNVTAIAAPEAGAAPDPHLDRDGEEIR